MPPSQAWVDDAGGRDHPRVDVERVGDPECDLVIVVSIMSTERFFDVFSSARKHR